jgi:hypothetical protein
VNGIDLLKDISFKVYDTNALAASHAERRNVLIPWLFERLKSTLRRSLSIEVKIELGKNLLYDPFLKNVDKTIIFELESSNTIASLALLAVDNDKNLEDPLKFLDIFTFLDLFDILYT